MEAKELGSAIEQAIAALRPEYRSCILLRHVEGRSYKEIATTLDLPLGTVKTYIHRARHELRRGAGAPTRERVMRVTRPRCQGSPDLDQTVKPTPSTLRTDPPETP